MKPPRECFPHAVQMVILHVVSLLVPASERTEWRQEWQCELWHVRAACMQEGSGVVARWSAERQVGEFCLGAFQDAYALFKDRSPDPASAAVATGSAMRTLSVMLGLVVLSCGAGLLLPGVRNAWQPTPYRDTRNLIVIQNAASSDDATPTIEAAQFWRWKERKQKMFDEFAFFRLRPEMLLNSGRNPIRVQIAEGSLNLFSALGLPVRFSPSSAGREMPQVILSDALWRREFKADRSVAGRAVEIGSRRAEVAGVAPADCWKLPGAVDLWMLQPDAAIPADAQGFVIAHLTPTVEHARLGENWAMSVPRADGGLDFLVCVSLAEKMRGPWSLFLFAVFLACLALPATTSLPLGEYPVTSRVASLRTRLRRWSFLASKVALLLPLALFVSLDLAHLSPVSDRDSVVYVQLVTCFSICLFGLRWTLRDQRQRCPVCLSKLTHPARVGEPSRNFLSWNGMELICTGGHGLLHVPEFETSWLGTQRWLYLDASWNVLFDDAGMRFLPAFD